MRAHIPRPGQLPEVRRAVGPWPYSGWGSGWDRLLYAESVALVEAGKRETIGMDV